MGTWALSESSDADALVVINWEVPVTRELYRRWDEASVGWDARTGVLDGGGMTMRNRPLASDYIRRANVRIQAIEVLYRAGNWPDVVRESQEALELALKGVRRKCGIGPRRLPDVSEVMRREQQRMPESVRGCVDRLASVSRELRRDR